MPSVLIVDDEEQILELLQQILESHGLEVTTAGNVAEAEESLHSGRPDVILSDVGMLGSEDGIELLDAVRENFGQIPFILMSGDPTREENALEHGANAFLKKPFSLLALIETIFRVMPGGSTGSA